MPGVRESEEYERPPSQERTPPEAVGPTLGSPAEEPVLRLGVFPLSSLSERGSQAKMCTFSSQSIEIQFERQSKPGWGGVVYPAC